MDPAGGADLGALLAEQVTYYRRRAPDYDEWWQRAGAYDRGPEARRTWDDEVATVRVALAAFRPVGAVLELAGGTGWWTAALAETAASLTVVDASPEALALNRERVGRDDVRYVVADLFSWVPPRRFDVVFFSYWLSHVPHARFDAFWALVEACLVPDGRVFIVEGRHDPTTSPDPGTLQREGEVYVRQLADGSKHRVVKVFYEPAELASQLEGLGWDATLAGTRWFLYGSAQRARHAPH